MPLPPTAFSTSLVRIHVLWLLASCLIAGSLSSYSVGLFPRSITEARRVDYYSLWNMEYRVETGFREYLKGTTYDFSGFFNDLYGRFLAELEITSWGREYQRPPLNYGVAAYAPGDPVDQLESIAHYVVYQTPNLDEPVGPNTPSVDGIVWYRDQQGRVYGNGDTVPDEIATAIRLTPEGGIVFIKAGTYTLDGQSLIHFDGKRELIIAGEGWNTILRLANGTNSALIRGTAECQRVIVRDLQVDGNLAENPEVTYTYGIEFTGGTSRNICIENVLVLNARRMGIVTREGQLVYFINNVVRGSGWNNMEHIRCNGGAAIGNYLADTRGVGYSTWGSHNIVVANTLSVGGIHDGLSPNDGNWGIGVETQGGAHPYDSYNIILRQNIASDHNASGPEEPWLGVGIWIMGTDHAGAGTYNIIVDGNIMQNNNRAGLVVISDSKYPERGNSIVVINNVASGNNRYYRSGGYYGNYVISRDVFFQNNTEA